MNDITSEPIDPGPPQASEALQSNTLLALVAAANDQPNVTIAPVTQEDATSSNDKKNNNLDQARNNPSDAGADRHSPTNDKEGSRSKGLPNVSQEEIIEDEDSFMLTDDNDAIELTNDDSKNAVVSGATNTDKVGQDASVLPTDAQTAANDGADHKSDDAALYPHLPVNWPMIRPLTKRTKKMLGVETKLGRAGVKILHLLHLFDHVPINGWVHESLAVVDNTSPLYKHLLPQEPSYAAMADRCGIFEIVNEHFRGVSDATRKAFLVATRIVPGKGTNKLLDFTPEPLVVMPLAIATSLYGRLGNLMELAKLRVDDNGTQKFPVSVTFCNPSLKRSLEEQHKTFNQHTLLITHFLQKDNVPDLSVNERKEIHGVVCRAMSIAICATAPGQAQAKCVLGCIVFRASTMGCFISYLRTNPANLPVYLGSLNALFWERPCQNNFIATWLVRAAQLYTVSLGHPIQTEVQVRLLSSEHRFFRRRGFRETTDIPFSMTLRQEAGEQFSELVKKPMKSNQGPVTYMSIKTAAGNLHTIEQSALPELFRGFSQDTEAVLQFPFNQPIPFLLQAGSQLLLLGTPFFGYRSVEAENTWVAPLGHGCKGEYVRIARDEIVQLKNWNTKTATEFSGRHIQLVQHWLLKDGSDARKSQFGIIPVSIGCLLFEFLEQLQNATIPRRLGEALHSFCCANRDLLARRYIILTYDRGSNHWVTVVAVNPFVPIAKGIKANRGENDLGYGCIVYDPLNPNQQGPHPVKASLMVFLLNYLSLYRDKAIHHQLKGWFAAASPHELFCRGGQGPFGVVVHTDNTPVGPHFKEGDCNDFLKAVHDERPKWKTPMICFPQGTFYPFGHKCLTGAACILFQMEFIMTQWNASYTVRSFSFDSSAAMYDHLDEDLTTFLQITDPNQFGYTFTTNHMNRKVSTGLCEMLIYELFILEMRLFYLRMNNDIVGQIYKPDPGNLTIAYTKMLSRQWAYDYKKTHHVEYKLPTGSENDAYHERLNGGLRDLISGKTKCRERTFLTEAGLFETPNETDILDSLEQPGMVHFRPERALPDTFSSVNAVHEHFVKEWAFVIQWYKEAASKERLRLFPDLQAIRLPHEVDELQGREDLNAFTQTETVAAEPNPCPPTDQTPTKKRRSRRQLPLQDNRTVVPTSPCTPAYVDKRINPKPPEPSPLMKSFGLARKRGSQIVIAPESRRLQIANAEEVEVDNYNLPKKRKREKPDRFQHDQWGSQYPKKTLRQLEKEREEKKARKEKRAEQGNYTYNRRMMVETQKSFNVLKEDEIWPTHGKDYMTAYGINGVGYGAALKEVTERCAGLDPESDSDSEADTTTDVAKAEAYISREILNREVTVEEMQNYVETLDTQQDKDRYTAWWHASKKAVSLEAKIMLRDSITSLRWEPGPYDRKRPNERKGQWIAIVNDMETGPYDQRTVPLATDWVEDRFDPTFLGILQKVSGDVHAVHKVGKGKNLQKKDGFVSLTHENKTFWLTEKQQVSGIQYDVNKEEWIGLIRTPSHKNKFEKLTEEWVDENIDVGVKDIIQQMASQGRRWFVNIPEGASNDSRDNIVGTEGAPKLHYQQKAGEKTCFLLAAASALHYVNEKQLGAEMFSKSNNPDLWRCAYDLFKTVMQSHGRHGFEVVELTNKYDPFNQCEDYLISMVGLFSDDGKRDHAVAIVGQWIFDSNFVCALPLTTESLDLCCSSNDQSAKFVSVSRGWGVVQKGKNRNKKRRGKKKKNNVKGTK